MALPQLNANPQYELTLPSNGKKVKFRPFVVKEEKALMIALEGGEPQSILYTLTDIIDSCTEMDVSARRLPSFDVEYIFLKIRAKSVGETATVGLKCDHCEVINEQEVQLDEIEPIMPEVTKTVDIGGGIFVELDYPAYADLIETTMVDVDSTTEQVMGIIQQCIVAVQTNDERILISDTPKEEVTAFLDSMNATQFSKIREFVENFPRLEQTFDFECTSCGKENHIVAEGINNFLS